MSLASESLLREIEQIAADVDRLARAGSDEETVARAAARRQRLLFELDTAGVLESDAAVRARLLELGLTALVAYHDAAVALRAYLASAERARLITAPPPTNVLEADVSLDWFRAPSPYRPPGVSGEAWLALCERNFIDPMPSGDGTRYVRLEGRIHQLLFRRETGPKPKLWRAELG